ncbi:MAG: deoxyribose-phosphate aldolase [Candidatus Limnocylindrales bacterium]
MGWSLPKTKADFAGYIDQTALRLGATREDIKASVREAAARGLLAVCVPPNLVPTARRVAVGATIKVATVVSFPLGADVAAVKAAEARSVCDRGADEIDVVINVAAARSAEVDLIADEVAAIRQAVASYGSVLKAIIEAPLLTPDQMIGAALAVERGGADIVSTSTDFPGLHLRPVTAGDIRMLREVLGAETGIEARGGITSTEDAIAAFESGATRVGTANGLAVLEGFDAYLR